MPKLNWTCPSKNKILCPCGPCIKPCIPLPLSSRDQSQFPLLWSLWSLCSSMSAHPCSLMIVHPCSSPLKRKALQALNRPSSEKLFFPIDDRATLLEALNRRGAVMKQSWRQMALSKDQCPNIRSGEVERWPNLILISLSIASSHLLDGDSKPQLVFDVLATINCQQEAGMGCRKIFSQC